MNIVSIQSDYLLLGVSLVIFLLGLLSYYHLIYAPHKSFFAGKSAWDRIYTAFSHIDDSKTGPVPHIIAGVLTLTGTSGLVSIVVVRLFDSEFRVSILLSVFSAITVIFFAAMEIWTLWQTRRIFFGQGFVVNDFKKLIQLLTEELNLLDNSIRVDHKFLPQQNHRVYAVAPHFFFGMLSFPGSTEERDYKNALLNICELKERCASNTFDLQIICHDELSIEKWHEDYYASVAEDARNELIEDANRKFEGLVADMDKAVYGNKNGSIFTRLSNVPNVQFMVIGNKLFEFTMNSKNTSTSIYNTQVISDSRQCDAYIEQFKFIQDLSTSSSRGLRSVS